MPTPTYTPLANVTLGAAASSVTFSSISQAYRDLVVIVSGKGTTDFVVNVTLNNDAGANYTQVNMRGYLGAFSSSTTVSSAPLAVNADPTTSPGMYVLNLLDYSATNKDKIILSRGQNAATQVNSISTRWANTSAVTTLKLATASSTFAAGSSFALYAIAS